MTEDAFIADLLSHLAGEPRPAGSARNAEIAAHLQSLYTSLGYTTEIDAHPFTAWEQDADPQIGLSAAGDHRIADRPIPVVWSAPGDVVGRILAAAPRPPQVLTFDAYPWDVLPVVGAAGREVARLLTGEEVWPQPLDEPSDLPHAMLRPPDAAWVEQHLSAGHDVTVRLRVSCRQCPGRTLRNVLARPPGESWPPKVLVAAHYDSFVGSPGAHDNASGSAAMALVARRMVDAAPGVGFAAFDAEEWNKLGAERHAAALEHAGRLADVRLMINVDSVGVGDHLYVLASSGLGDAIKSTLRSAGATVRVGTARLPSGRWVFVQEDPAIKPFDAWPFMRRGVPAVQIGSLGDRPFDQWHQPGDSLDRIGEAGRNLIADAAGVVEVLARAAW